MNNSINKTKPPITLYSQKIETTLGIRKLFVFGFVPLMLLLFAVVGYLVVITLASYLHIWAGWVAAIICVLTLQAEFSSRTYCMLPGPTRAIFGYFLLASTVFLLYREHKILEVAVVCLYTAHIFASKIMEKMSKP